MPKKNKITQPITPDKIQKRDLFQTPRYATEILLSYIPKHIKNIWECAYGFGKISGVLREKGYNVICTDLSEGFNFLADKVEFSPDDTMIVTNPPFSLKSKFYKRCKQLDIPFALLIPSDYSGWMIDAIENGCEKIIPTTRINYITPNAFNRIFERYGVMYNSMNVPLEYLKEDFQKSSSQFHSLWLTKGLNLGRSETFFKLTKQMKENI